MNPESQFQPPHAGDSLSGGLRKMRVTHTDPVTYDLPLGDHWLPLTDRIGDVLRLRYTGRIHCIACGRITKKSFAQGYCFPCFKRLAECDLCIMKPETCHRAQGTCRDPQWADDHCQQEHIVYLANSSDLKVGITRHSQIPTRWIDQGATQAIPLWRVKSRFHSGLLEVALKKYLSDKTDWRKLLRGDPTPVDMEATRQQLRNRVAPELALLKAQHAGLEWTPVDDAAVAIRYPITRLPNKVTSLSFDRSAEISGVLWGIKGQYLIFDCGVINIRKFAGYEVEAR